MTVYFTVTKGVYTFFLLNEKGKPQQVPVEQCTRKEIFDPPKEAMEYWKHYGIDRKYFLSKTKLYSP